MAGNVATVVVALVAAGLAFVPLFDGASLFSLARDSMRDAPGADAPGPDPTGLLPTPGAAAGTETVAAVEPGALAAWNLTTPEDLHDGDGDGIPDKLEFSGLLAPWNPAVGRTDLLVSYVVVRNPDVSEADLEPLEDALVQVYQFFHAQDIRLLAQVETVSSELIAERGSDALALEVLPGTMAASNPFVHTVVLVAETRDADDPIGGYARLGSHLAYASYASGVVFTFQGQSGGTYEFRGGWAQCRAQGLPDCSSGLLRSWSGDGRHGYEERLGSTSAYVEWDGSWPDDARVWVDDQRYHRTEASYDAQETANLILHELGHNLGLCHTHEDDCADGLSTVDRSKRHESVMSYEHHGPAHYLPSEWTRVRAQLACSYEGFLEASDDPEALLMAKYGVGPRTDVPSGRHCH